MTEEQYVRVNLEGSTYYDSSIYLDYIANAHAGGVDTVLSAAIPQIESCKVCVTQLQLPLSRIPVGYMGIQGQSNYTDPVYVLTTTAEDGIAGKNKGTHSLGLELKGQVGVTFNPLNAVPDKTFGPNDFHQRDRLYNADDSAPVNGHYYDTGKLYQEHLVWFKDFETTGMYRMRVNGEEEFDDILASPTHNKRLNNGALSSEYAVYPFRTEGDILSCLSDAFTGALLINRKGSNSDPSVLHLGLPEKIGYVPLDTEEVELDDLYKSKIKPGNLYIPPRVSFFIDENDCVGFTFSPGFASVTEVINDHVQGEDADVSTTTSITHFTATSTTVAKNITEKASAHPRHSNPNTEIPLAPLDCENMRQICRNVIASPIPYYAEDQAHVSLFTPGADIDKIRQSSMGSTITVAGVSRLNVEGTSNYSPDVQVTIDEWWSNNTVNTTLTHPDQTFLERFYFTVNKHVANLIPGLPWIPVTVSGNYATPDMQISGYNDGGFFPNIAYALDTTKARMTAELPVISPSWAYGLAGGGNPTSISNIDYRRLAYMLSLVKYRFVFPTVKSCALNSIHSFVIGFDDDTRIGESVDDQGQTVIESLESPAEICKSEYYRDGIQTCIPIATFPYSDKDKMKHLTYFTIDRPYEESHASICNPRYIPKYYWAEAHRLDSRPIWIRAFYRKEESPRMLYSPRGLLATPTLRLNVQLTFCLKLAYL